MRLGAALCGAGASGLLGWRPQSHDGVLYSVRNLLDLWRRNCHTAADPQYPTALCLQRLIATIDNTSIRSRTKSSTRTLPRSAIFTGSNPGVVLADSDDAHEWLTHKRLPNGFWDAMDTQRRFFAWASVLIGVTKMEDWYSIKTEDFCRRTGASSLLRLKYQSSLILAVKAVYPEHPWRDWEFSRAPKSLWKDAANIRKYLDELASKVGVIELQDWYSVNLSQFIDNHAMHLIATVRKEEKGNNASIMYTIVKRAYPEHVWQERLFRSQRSIWADKDACKSLLLEIQTRLGFESTLHLE